MKKTVVVEFQVVIRGEMVVDSERLEEEVQARRRVKEEIGGEMVKAAVMGMARPGLGPLVFEEADLPLVRVSS